MFRKTYQSHLEGSRKSLIQRSPSERGVTEYEHEASIMKRSWPTRGHCASGRKKLGFSFLVQFHECTTLVFIYTLVSPSRTNGWCLGTFQKALLFPESESTGYKSTLT
jgi:hypothetical protein